MAKYFAVCVFVCSSLLAFSQSDFNGQWKSSVLGMDVYIKITDQLLLTIPTQGVLDEKATNFEIDSDKIDFYFRKFSATFIGELKNDTISGKWKQAGREFHMDFVRNEDLIEIKRSQEPLQDINYVSEEVTFPSSGEEGFLIAGTLTKPQGTGPFPAIVLVSGSGPQNRNSEFYNHRPFLILADFFTRSGYAVLRYDDRGIGKSKGYFAKVTTMDLAMDTDGAIEYLSKRDDIIESKMGIMGHSEGGMIAPIVASQNEKVDFIVLLAGPGQPVKDLMLYQLNRQYARMQGFSMEGVREAESFNEAMIDLLIQDVPNDKIVDDLRQLTSSFYYSLSEKDQMIVAPSEQQLYFQTAPGMMNAYMRYFLAFNPEDYLTKVKVPTLALNGKKDIQVTYKENIDGIKNAYKSSGHQKLLKCITYKNLNHLFQTSETGEGDEYFTNEETFNPKAMEDILKWLNNL